MKLKRIAICIAVATIALTTSCGNAAKKSSTSQATTQTENQAESKTAEVYNIDKLLTDAEVLTNKEVIIEGICTHICKHGGRKIFLMGSDDTKTIRIESGKMGKFDQNCVNSIVNVTGILREERIDETYLINWENRLKTKSEEQHGEGESGCDTEKKARGESANTDEKRIADFRTKIATRKAQSGKEYLSFYYVEADKYTVK